MNARLFGHKVSETPALPFPFTPPRPLFATLLATTLIGGTPLATSAEDAGAYLATRQADMQRDFQHVVDYGARALAADPERQDVLEGLLVAQTGLGQVDKAVPYARRLHGISTDSQLAGLILLGDHLAQNQWGDAIAMLDNGTSIGGMIDRMIRAWASIGQGRMSDALDIFDALSKTDSSRDFALYQKALALAHVGDFEGSARILGGDEGALHLNRSAILAYTQVLSQLERHDDALELLKVHGANQPDPELTLITEQIKAGDVLPFTALTSPNDAISELLLAVSEGRSSESDKTVALLFSRLGEHLAPNNAGAALLSAQLLEIMGRHALAVEAYGRVPENSPFYQQAALGRTDVLRRSDRLDEAVGELRALADAYPDTLRFRVALGDTLMQQDRFKEARTAYDKAISGFSEDLPGQWATYFQRAIALSKINEWPAAEVDFRKALELSPEEPNVLNYLGYTYVEMKINMDEALNMIERAVAARPNSGYIVDSLGWVLFRLGRYDEAVEQMERAVELIPIEPILNDHLGDTYWAVGRKREAEFQWRRALSFITDDTDLDELKPDRIRRKLELGLDAVLEDEGTPPLHAAQ